MIPILTDHVELSIHRWTIIQMLDFCSGLLIGLAIGLTAKLVHRRSQPGIHFRRAPQSPQITLKSIETTDELARQCRQPESK